MSDIADFLRSLLDTPQATPIFEPQFQTYDGFCRYLTGYFGAGNGVDVHTLLKNTPSKTFKADYFQALFIACWIYKPMEKGTYFLRMTNAEAENVKKAFEALPSRKSSHLDGKGRSAHKGFAFLKGYEELLVQWVATNERTYLMLKCEGHTTGIGGIVPHLQSWNHKRKHGVGLMANPALNTLTKENNSPIIDRGAENFSKDYEAFLTQLGKVRGVKKLDKATTSIRDMLVALTGEQKWKNATNLDVQTKLNTLVNGGNSVNGVDLTQGTKQQFTKFAQLIGWENRPTKVYDRYFEEVHVNPEQLSNAIKDFFAVDLPVSSVAQSKRRSEMLHFA
jgi:hypothetical protein